MLQGEELSSDASPRTVAIAAAAEMPATGRLWLLPPTHTHISALSRLGGMLNLTWHCSSGCWIACQSQAKEMGRERDGGRVWEKTRQGLPTRRHNKEEKEGQRTLKEGARQSREANKELQKMFRRPFEKWKANNLQYLPPPPPCPPANEKKETSVPPKSGRRRTSYPFSSLSTIPFTTEIFPVDGLKDRRVAKPRYHHCPPTEAACGTAPINPPRAHFLPGISERAGSGA